MSDAATALAQALTPKSGMQRVAWPLESYQHQSPPLSAKHLVNLMAEQAPADARTPTPLISTAGLDPAFTCGTGPVFEMNDDMPAIVYVLSGANVYRVQWTGPGGTPLPVMIGGVGITDANNPQLRPSIAVGPTAVVVCIPPNAWTASHTGSLNQLGGTFPGDASSVAYLDGYFVFTRMSDWQQFFISELLDPTNYDALDFASLDAFTNYTTRVVTLGTDLWFAGINGWEIWYDAGAADFPFRRQPSGIIQRTVITPHSIAVGDGSVFWLSTDYIVQRSNGYHATRISTHAIETILRAYQAPAVYSAVVYGHAGHVLYCINLSPVGSLPARTLVYDCTTKLWHDRSSDGNGNGRWRVNASSVKFVTLLGDYFSGTVYEPKIQLPTDNGVPVFRQAVCPPIWAGTNRAFCSRVELEMEVGGALSPGTVTLEWSDDGGNTWKGPRVLSTGAASEFRKRVVATRLGSFRARIFRFTCSGHATFYALDADIQKGAW